MQPMAKDERTDFVGGQSVLRGKLAECQIFGHAGQAKPLPKLLNIGGYAEPSVRSGGDRERSIPASNAELVEPRNSGSGFLFAAELSVSCRERGKPEFIVRIEPGRSRKGVGRAFEIRDAQLSQTEEVKIGRIA